MSDPLRIRVKIFSESIFTVKGHGVHSAFVDSVEALREIADIDVVPYSARRADVTHLHTVGPLSVLLLSRSERTAVTAHITAESLAGSLVGGKVFAGVWRKYLAWFYNRVDVVIALHSTQEAELRRSGVAAEVVTMHPGIRRRKMPSRTSARTQLGIGEHERVVLSVGQVQPRKAVLEFHRIAAELPDVRFIWVGGFPFGLITAKYREMRKLVREHPHNVVHAGQLSRENVQLYYAAADLYLHPSHQEHAPVAVFEAAAAGLPLVLRDIDCYRRLYPERYLAATDGTFTTQVQRLLKEPDLHKAMSDHATAIADEYSPLRSATELAGVYRRLAVRSG